MSEFYKGNGEAFSGSDPSRVSTGRSDGDVIYAEPEEINVVVDEQPASYSNETVFCIHCGAQNQKGTPVCSFCGLKIISEDGEKGFYDPNITRSGGYQDNTYGNNGQGSYGNNSQGSYGGYNGQGSYGGNNSQGSYGGYNSQGGYGGNGGNNSQGSYGGYGGQGGYGGYNGRGGYGGYNNQSGYGAQNNFTRQNAANINQNTYNTYNYGTPPQGGQYYNGGYPQGVVPMGYKNKYVTFLLCLFLGFFGIHRLYEGKVGTGLLWMFSFGLGTIGWFVDLVISFVRLFSNSTYYKP